LCSWKWEIFFRDLEIRMPLSVIEVVVFGEHIAMDLLLKGKAEVHIVECDGWAGDNPMGTIRVVLRFWRCCDVIWSRFYWGQVFGKCRSLSWASGLHSRGDRFAEEMARGPHGDL
jgi:hypothetical protein